MTSATIYEPEDIVWLSRSLSLHFLMNPASALPALRKQATELLALPRDGVMNEDTPVETLITADGYLRSLGGYDHDLRDDLLIRSTDPELLTLGGLLALLSPLEGDLAVLGHSRRRAGAESWMVDLAHRQASGTDAGELAEHLSLVRQIADALDGIARPKPRLWKVADIPHEAIAALRVETERLYKSGGAEAAHRHLSNAMNAPDSGALGQYLKDRSARRG